MVELRPERERLRHHPEGPFSPFPDRVLNLGAYRLSRTCPGTSMPFCLRESPARVQGALFFCSSSVDPAGGVRLAQGSESLSTTRLVVPGQVLQHRGSCPVSRRSAPKHKRQSGSGSSNPKTSSGPTGSRPGPGGSSGAQGELSRVLRSLLAVSAKSTRKGPARASSSPEATLSGSRIPGSWSCPCKAAGTPIQSH